MRQEAENAVGSRRQLRIIPIHGVPTGGIGKRRGRSAGLETIRRKHGGFRGAAARTDILAQHSAPADGCACQHHTHSIDQTALREIHRLCRKIVPLHARDELYDSMCDSTLLSHVIFTSRIYAFGQIERAAGVGKSKATARCRYVRIPVIDARTERGSRIGQRPLSTCARKSPRIRLNSSGASRLTV